MSFDSVEILSRFSVQGEISFSLLSDPDSSAIRSYGVYKEDGRGIPHPAIFVIDRDGTIIAKLRHEGYKKRHGSQDILAAVNSGDPPAPEPFDKLQSGPVEGHP